MSTAARDLDWLINGFTERVPGAANAVVVSSDGLVLAMSDRLDRAHADQLAEGARGGGVGDRRGGEGQAAGHHGRGDERRRGAQIAHRESPDES